MKLKVCGMKYEDNIRQVANLDPDYMGFIFYKGSKRYVEGALPEISGSVVKTGVFVNAPLEDVMECVNKNGLDAVQLHGDESPEYCSALKEAFRGEMNLEIIKAFPVGGELPSERLESYLGHCDSFLFDTKGSKRGGTGKRFDWSVLEGYALDHPYFLSGGIGPEHLEELDRFLSSKAARSCKGIDLNSRFESSPAIKDINSLKAFIQEFKKMKI